MKFHLFTVITVLLGWAVMNSSCSSSGSATKTQPPAGVVAGKEAADSDDPRKLHAEEKFIEAKKMEILGDNQSALNLYKECIKADPTIDAAFYNAAKIFFDQKQYQDAVAFASQAVKLNPKNEWYLDLYGTLLGGMGNYKEAVKVYQQMVQQNPDNADAWFNWAFFLDQNRQTEEAIEVFDQMEERFGINEDVSLEKEKLWLKTGKVDKAAAELQKLIDTYPDEARYYSMLVDLYMTNKMEDKAYNVLQEMIKVDPDNPRANLVMADYYRLRGEDEKSFESLQRAFASPDLDINIKIPLLASFLPTMQNDLVKKSQAVKLGESLVKVHGKDARSHALYGDILYQNDQLGPALDEYKTSLELDNSKFFVWQQVMFLHDRIRSYDSLIAISNRAIDLFPDQNMAFYFNGYANLQLKNYQEAVNSFGKAVAIGSEDKKFIAQLYSDMGDAYYNLGNHAASDSCYNLALVFDPENAYVLNNYSYYLSLRGEKLEEAKKMSGRANSLAPDNSAYQDTYAWVLYKLGEYNEARLWLEKALKNGGDGDGTILEHYGDILYRLGDNSAAVQFWMKAREKNVESETIDKKIADRKLYE